MMHPLLALYRGFWWLVQPLVPWWLARRVALGKEDAARLGERRGFAGIPRPAGRLVWMHGASVGEALALLPLLVRLQALGYNVLLTTGTLTSARLMAQRLPPGALHQFVPLDAPPFMARFLAHWQPQLILLAESELWPNLLAAARQRAIALALVNARMSARSFARWMRVRGFIATLLGMVDLCLAQSPEDAARLTALGAAGVQVCGNLKFDAAPLPADAAALDDLARSIGRRPCWIAASTHEGEDEIALGAHAALALRFPALLTVIAPRHPARAGPIAQLAGLRGLQVARRSQSAPVLASTDVYLCDTIGDLGLLYRLGGPVFLGKSLAGSGGQNPVEAALLGNAIVHGPAVQNFATVYHQLDAAGGALCVADAPDLQAQLATLLTDAATREIMAQRAAAFVHGQRGATDAVMAALQPLLAAPIGGRNA